MSDVKFDLLGVADLKATLAELNSESALKVGNVATREGAKIVKSAFVASAPRGTESTFRTRTSKNGTVTKVDYGHLFENLTIKKRAADKQHQIKYSVGVGSAFWGIFSEFGTRHQAANPWLRPAFDAVAPQVVDAIGSLVGTGITREARRLNRKAKKQGL